MEQKLILGRLENPIRFTGYRLLKEMGFSFSGENYEDINRWGQRMADTTITSEQVIYLAAKKRYANRTVHVFRSFTRAGDSDKDGTVRNEKYEVSLEDWLLDNLNQNYVVPEDLSAYRKLKRPTGKGVFGYLHIWFHASRGRQVERDYGELCMLLNIPKYNHVSKIRETMGRSLDELVEIGYLGDWKIAPMTSKDGYKLVLGAGEQLLHALAISRRKELGEAVVEQVCSAEQEEAQHALIERGISPQKAASLGRHYAANEILDQIEYAEFLAQRSRRKTIENPAGFIIYTIENQILPPSSFESSRRIRERGTEALRMSAADIGRTEARERYEEHLDSAVQETIDERFPVDSFGKNLASIVLKQKRLDNQFAKLSDFQQRVAAEQMLRRELREELMEATSFEDWCASREQLDLFAAN